ncbi:MAG: hypothetical protein NVSMB1_19580 [Polyangiales bacterium]
MHERNRLNNAPLGALGVLGVLGVVRSGHVHYGSVAQASFGIHGLRGVWGLKRNKGQNRPNERRAPLAEEFGVPAAAKNPIND